MERVYILGVQVSNGIFLIHNGYIEKTVAYYLLHDRVQVPMGAVVVGWMSLLA